MQGLTKAETTIDVLKAEGGTGKGIAYVGDKKVASADIVFAIGEKE